ncbi:hypothetical protein Q9L58_005609 [Maublancomyces gigas]|uniref:Uncharacterized protein n=1 Tax=Discina gigas TaxID=1032678 RepID=A0ABR3GHQ4_9PEZI
MAHIPLPPVAHVHGDDIKTIRISSCLYAYEYKGFLCFTCPDTTLFSELKRAIKADSTWWAPAENLTIACRQGSLIGDSFMWSNASEMEILQTRLINEVQFDREMLLAVHRTLLNWRFGLFVLLDIVIVVVLMGVWLGKGHEGDGGHVPQCW